MGSVRPANERRDSAARVLGKIPLVVLSVWLSLDGGGRFARGESWSNLIRWPSATTEDSWLQFGTLSSAPPRSQRLRPSPLGGSTASLFAAEFDLLDPESFAGWEWQSCAAESLPLLASPFGRREGTLPLTAAGTAPALSDPFTLAPPPAGTRLDIGPSPVSQVSYSQRIHQAEGAQVTSEAVLLLADLWQGRGTSLLIRGAHSAGSGTLDVPGRQAMPLRFAGPWSGVGAAATMPDRAGSIDLGHRLAVSGEIVDGGFYPTVATTDFPEGRFFDIRDRWLVSRVGIHQQIMPGLVTGFYAFEQASLLGYADELPVASTRFSPYASENHWAGVQTQSSDGRWAFAAAGFFTDHGDAESIFPAMPSGRRRGAELALHAGVTPKWTATVRLSEVASSGTSQTNGGVWTAPRTQTSGSATIWNRINIYQRRDQLLTVGVGTRLVSEYRDSYGNSLILPGFSRWDLGLFYRRDGLDSRLYVEGFLDSGYYRDLDWLLNDPDSPLSIKAQMRLEY